VCSDGVTFTTTVPYVTNFTFDGVRRKNQFIIDGNGTLWLVDCFGLVHYFTVEMNIMIKHIYKNEPIIYTVCPYVI
jgi:hypothetical protein